MKASNQILEPCGREVAAVPVFLDRRCDGPCNRERNGSQVQARNKLINCSSSKPFGSDLSTTTPVPQNHSRTFAPTGLAEDTWLPFDAGTATGKVRVQNLRTVLASPPQYFTSATRATTVPVKATQFGFETDTGLLYHATGTGPGNWAVTISVAGRSGIVVLAIDDITGLSDALLAQANGLAATNATAFTLRNDVTIQGTMVGSHATLLAAQEATIPPTLGSSRPREAKSRPSRGTSARSRHKRWAFLPFRTIAGAKNRMHHLTPFPSTGRFLNNI
jgi:hypothetical protein